MSNLGIPPTPRARVRSWTPILAMPLAGLLALAPAAPLRAQAPTPQRLVDAAPTPPMGWNSYDYYNWTVSESEMLANARWEAKHLAAYGWKYVVVDFLWSTPLHGDYEHREFNRDGSYRYHLSMDRYGRLVPDPKRFPSSVNGVGFKALADSVHALGLKFGIHVMRGIPRQAVREHTPVLGTSYTADQIADTASKCAWDDGMYGLDMSKPGAQAYLDSLLKLYASWGVDFIKVDDILRPWHGPEIAGYSKAIEHTGRRIVLSLSPGPAPTTEAGFLTHTANMWRLTDDVWDDWSSMKRDFAHAAAWAGTSRPGSWPDLDMLPLGRIAARYPKSWGGAFSKPDRASRLTHDEQRTMMTLWAIYRSPLMMGGNLPENDAWTTSLLTNRAVIEVDQHSRDNRMVRGGGYPVYTADAATGPDRYVALFNTTDDTATVSVALKKLGLDRATPVDLWTGKRLAPVDNEVSATLAPHASVLLRLEVR